MVMMLKLGGNLMAKEKIESQEKILNFVNDYVKENGYPPSIREIAANFDLSSPATAHVHVNKLIEKGYLKRGKGSKANNEAFPFYANADAFCYGSARHTFALLQHNSHGNSLFLHKNSHNVPAILQKQKPLKQDS